MNVCDGGERDELDAAGCALSPTDGGVSAGDAAPSAPPDGAATGQEDAAMQPDPDDGAVTPTRDAEVPCDACDGGSRVCAGGTEECVPGETEPQTEACGACGTGTRTRTCSIDCTWQAWADWSACSGITAACSPGPNRRLLARRLVRSPRLHRSMRVERMHADRRQRLLAPPQREPRGRK